MKSGLPIALSVAIVITGCSTASKDITPTYTSPLYYTTYGCEQMVQEELRLQRRVGELGAMLDDAAENDKAIAGVGAILFWPALFALGGTKEQEAEYGRLRGEHEALQQAAIQKNCILPAPQPMLDEKDAPNNELDAPNDSPTQG